MDEYDTMKMLGIGYLLKEIKDRLPDLVETEEVPENYETYKVANAISWKFEIGNEPGDPVTIRESVDKFVNGLKDKIKEDKEKFGKLIVSERLFVFGDTHIHRHMKCGFYGWVEFAIPRK